MAAIVPITHNNLRRTGTAQADTGQTDWIEVPSWGKFLVVQYSLTAVAGTTPTMTPSLLAADPIARDDGTVSTLATFTGMTAAASGYIQVGPGVTGIADDATTAATGAGIASINMVLPKLLGVKVLLDRTDTDETYTYTVAAYFKS